MVKRIFHHTQQFCRTEPSVAPVLVEHSWNNVPPRTTLSDPLLGTVEVILKSRPKIF